MTPSPAQLRCLKRAIANNGSIECGGLDDDGIRIDVAMRCYNKGWLQWHATGPGKVNVLGFSITDKGRKAVEITNVDSTGPRVRTRRR